jgi:hypothetical protein
MDHLMENERAAPWLMHAHRGPRESRTALQAAKG